MAATIHSRKTAKIIPFPAVKAVETTDCGKRLPTLSSAQIEDFFDHMQRRDQKHSRAA